MLSEYCHLEMIERSIINKPGVRVKFLLPFLVLIFLSDHIAAQSQHSSEIRVSCIVLDENAQPLSNIIVVNKRTRTGTFGNSNGRFSISCFKTDTLTITSLGFYSREISFRDSIDKEEYSLKIFLETRAYSTAEVVVFAPRDLEKIQDDISKLGYNERDYMLSGLDAAQSPITFLYQQFSKKERSKRLVSQLENEDRKRDLLKELFQHYVTYDIIKLSDDEFDTFIDFIHVSDEFMKSSSQYDFLMYVKFRFKDYQVYKRQKKTMTDGDFDYDKD